MEVPESVIVGPRRFDIVKVSTGDMPEKYADCIVPESRIRLRDNLSPQVERESLLHELLHAVVGIHCTGMQATTDGWVQSEWEELVVSCMEPGLIMLLRDNPDIVTYLTESV